MHRYVIKRILWLIPVILAVSFIVFMLMELAPGSVVDLLVTEHSTPEDIAALRESYNLDKSVFYRYVLYLFNLFQGNLGVSELSKLNVWDTFMERLPNTLLLTFTSIIIASVLAVSLGIFAARRAGTLADTAMTTIAVIGQSAPTFWIGLLLLLLFSMHLGWFPAGGNWNGLRSLVLPSLCSAFALMSTSTRLTRSSMLDVLSADYLRTARAKGVPEKVVVRKHALKNAWIPIITSLGQAAAVSIAGSAVIETVFAWPGIGWLTVQSVLARDVTMTTGLVIMTTILYVLVQLIVDFLYAFVDPRIKSQYLSKKKKRAPSKRGGGANRQHESAIPVLPLIITGAPMKSDDCLTEPDANLPAQTVKAVNETTIPALNTVPAHKEGGTSDIVINANTGHEQFAGMKHSGNSTKSDHEIELIIKQYKKNSRMGEIAHSLRKNKGSMFGIIVICLLFLLMIISLFMSFESVTEPNVSARLSHPSWQFPFGTDRMGRDSFLRVIYGSRYTLVIGVSTVALSVLFGVPLGTIAGFYGGKVDNTIMRISDTLASIPGMLLGMVLLVVLGMNLPNLILAVFVGHIPVYIRITRASILSLVDNEFVDSARATGLSNFRIMFTQILPNGLSPILVTMSSSVGIMILCASALSFLGFGIPVPTPEWGSLVAQGRDLVSTAPWLMTFPGLFIMLTVLSFNLIGDGLRDALDPKMKK